MTAHIGDELPRLLTGEADREEVMAAAAHLRACPDCQQELVSAVVAHASLVAAHRFAPEAVVRPAAAGPRPAQPPEHPLPDLSSMFADVRADTDHRARRRPNGRLLAVAAAAAVVVGGGVTAGVVATSSHGPATRSVALVAADRTVATATLIGTDHMRIDATSLPKLDASHQYEVWLTGAGVSSPQPVGWIGSNREADIHVPSAVMLSYQDIAVSVQGVHQTRFSGDVVARGAYA